MNLFIITTLFSVNIAWSLRHTDSQMTRRMNLNKKKSHDIEGSPIVSAFSSGKFGFVAKQDTLSDYIS